jgi:hypothetical protein
LVGVVTVAHPASTATATITAALFTRIACISFSPY